MNQSVIKGTSRILTSAQEREAAASDVLDLTKDGTRLVRDAAMEAAKYIRAAMPVPAVVGDVLLKFLGRQQAVNKYGKAA